MKEKMKRVWILLSAALLSFSAAVQRAASETEKSRSAG